MVTIGHDYPFDNDSLLVNEIRIVVALMNVRLIIDEKWTDHNVVPVQAFSLTSHKQGRILQAHLDREGLVIRKSQIYDFSSRPDAHLDLFLQYMVSDIQGSTSMLDLPKIEYDFSV